MNLQYAVMAADVLDATGQRAHVADPRINAEDAGIELATVAAVDEAAVAWIEIDSRLHHTGCCKFTGWSASVGFDADGRLLYKFLPTYKGGTGPEAFVVVDQARYCAAVSAIIAARRAHETAE